MKSLSSRLVETRLLGQTWFVQEGLEPYATSDSLSDYATNRHHWLSASLGIWIEADNPHVAWMAPFNDPNRLLDGEGYPLSRLHMAFVAPHFLKAQHCVALTSEVGPLLYSHSSHGGFLSKIMLPDAASLPALPSFMPQYHQECENAASPGPLRVKGYAGMLMAGGFLAPYMLCVAPSGQERGWRWLDLTWELPSVPGAPPSVRKYADFATPHWVQSFEHQLREGVFPASALRL